jgi:hypothetical protein
MPTPNKEETESEFVRRYMQSEESKKKYPDEKQRLAIAFSVYRKSKGGK